MAEPVSFEKFQEYANNLEDDYMSKLEEQKKMQKDLKNLNNKFESFRIETAFAAAEWRGLNQFCKSHFGKELKSKASKEDDKKPEASSEPEKKAEV